MKKRMTAVLLIALIFAAAFPVGSFAAKNGLNKTKVNMTVGSSTRLKLKYRSGKVKWSSSKRSVATVSKKGKVTAHRKGTAYITAKASGKKYKCRIIVNEPSVSDIDYSQYLISTKNCQVGHASIKNQTNALCNGLTTDTAKATAIFNFVRDEISTVSYEQTEIYVIKLYYYNVIFGNETRYGAAGTLSAKEGNDADKAHLLIAMLRTAGIPARYCYGSCRFTGVSGDIARAINNEDYTDHVWAECLISDKWVPVDATREVRQEVYTYGSNNYVKTFFEYYTDNGLGIINTWKPNDYKLYGRYASLPF